MKKLLQTSSIVALLAFTPQVFANANAGSTLWIGVTVADGSSTPQAYDADLTLVEYEAVTVFWTQISAVGSHGETGSSTNILTYDTWDTVVVQKAKGMTNAGDPEVELAVLPVDPGQLALRAAALTNNNYIFKIVRNDAPSAGTPTIVYNRGLVVGPKSPNGRNEDYDIEIFTLGLQQIQIKDYAAA